MAEGQGWEAAGQKVQLAVLKPAAQLPGGGALARRGRSSLWVSLSSAQLRGGLWKASLPC